MPRGHLWEAPLAFVLAAAVMLATIVIELNIENPILGIVATIVEAVVPIALSWRRRRFIAWGVIVAGVPLIALAIVVGVIALRGGFQLGHD